MEKHRKGLLLGLGLLLMILIAIILYAALARSQINFPQEEGGKVKVVVKLKDVGYKGFTLSSYNAEEKSKHLQDVSQKFGILRHVFPEENAFSVELTWEELASLKKEAFVEEVRELRTIQAFLQNTVGVINATPTWSLQRNGVNITGSGETVCIIDTGVNFSHPDLQGKNATGCIIDCLGKPSCVSNCSATDDHGHGTHVAGIVGANGSIKGVAPDVKIIAVKVLNATGSGTEDDLKTAIDFCVSNSSIYNISVISLSLGTDTLYSTYCDVNYSGTPNITKAVNDAAAKNISVIAATGNNNNKNSIAAPACIRNVTAVARSSNDDTAHSNGNSNNITDLIAPGTSVVSTCVSGGSCTKSGTSMSTPHVAAAFALVRQFKRLDSQLLLTPPEIENTLKATGKMITDSNGLNFSRIDIYAAVLSLQNPIVVLVSPANGTRTKNQINFTCNATTDSSSAFIANITLLLYNGTALLYNETKNTTGASNQTSFNYTLSVEGDYLWSCRASDNRSYRGTSQNFTITYDLTPPLITIISPQNTTYKDGFFNVSLNENGSWCGYSLDHGGNVSMTRINDTYFNYTVTNISSGLRNVSFSCNDSAGNVNATAMRWFTINQTSPLVVLNSPADGYSANSGSSVDFRYNVTHNRNISSCSLIIDSVHVSFNTTFVNTSAENNFTYSPQAGSHTWNINCTDDLGNIGNAASRSFTINTPQVVVNAGGGGNGGGGGSPTSGTTYILTQSELGRGASKQLEKDDRIKFILYENGTNVTHYINITNVTDTSATLVIYSQPKIVILKVGDSEKVELTGDDYYDLFLQLINIANKKANVTVRLIYEQTPPVRNENKNESREQKENNVTDETGVFREPEGGKIKEGGGETLRLKRMVLLAIVVLLILAAFLHYYKRKRKIFFLNKEKKKN